MGDLVLVGDAFLRDDRAVAVRQRRDRRGAHAPRRAAAGEHHGIHLVPDQQRRDRAVVEHAGHALVHHRIAATVHIQARVQFGAGTMLLDVLQGVRGVGSTAPDAGIVGVVHVGDVGPDHRHVLAPRQRRERVDVFDLPRMGLVGGAKGVGVGVGALQVDVDQGRFLAKAELGAIRVGLHFVPILSGREIGALHHRRSH